MKIPSIWTFKDNEVASKFDTHVREQLPWYDLATNMVSHIAKHYIPDNGLVYDIGASTGNIGKSLSEVISARNARFVAIDNSKNMENVYAGGGEFINCDALELEYDNFDVCICFLVVMFMPVSKREEWLKKLINKVNKGGIVIIFDKVFYSSGYLSTVLHRLTMSEKLSLGCKADEILQKELSLSGIQRPLSNETILNINPFFTEVFRFGEFAGWVLEKR